MSTNAASPAKLVTSSNLTGHTVAKLGGVSTNTIIPTKLAANFGNICHTGYSAANLMSTDAQLDAGLEPMRFEIVSTNAASPTKLVTALSSSSLAGHTVEATTNAGNPTKPVANLNAVEDNNIRCTHLSPIDTMIKTHWMNFLSIKGSRLVVPLLPAQAMELSVQVSPCAAAPPALVREGCISLAPIQAYLVRNFDHHYSLTILKIVYLNILTKNRRSLKTANISLYVDLTKNLFNPKMISGFGYIRDNHLVSIRQSLDFSVAGKSASEFNNIRCNLKPTYLAALITIIKTHFMNFLSILTLLVIIQAYLLRNTDHYYNLTILKKVYLNILTKNCQSHKTAHSSLHIDLLDGKHINSNQCRRVMK